MDAKMIDLTYVNLLPKFFEDDKLIAGRTERIERCYQFVLENVPNRDLSQKLQDVVKNKVSSFELTFYKKWRESKCKCRDQFEKSYEKWIHMDLKVNKYIFWMHFLHKVSSINDFREKYKFSSGAPCFYFVVSISLGKYTVCKITGKMYFVQ